MKTVLLVLAVIWGGSLIAIVLGTTCVWLFGQAKDRQEPPSSPEAVSPLPLPVASGPARRPTVSEPSVPIEAASPRQSQELVIFRKLHRTRRARDGSASGVDRSA